jgi:hypothetical protein
MHAAMATVCFVKGEDSFTANRRDDGIIRTDRPKDLGKIIGKCREAIPAEDDERAHCSEPQFLAESEHVESPFNSGLRRILSLKEILDHFCEIRCGHCHKSSFFLVLVRLTRFRVGKRNCRVAAMAGMALARPPAVRSVEYAYLAR